MEFYLIFMDVWDDESSDRRNDIDIGLGYFARVTYHCI